MPRTIAPIDPFTFEKGDILLAMQSEDVQGNHGTVGMDPKAIDDLAGHPVIVLDGEREGYCVVVMASSQKDTKEDRAWKHANMKKGSSIPMFTEVDKCFKHMVLTTESHYLENSNGSWKSEPTMGNSFVQSECIYCVHTAMLKLWKVGKAGTPRNHKIRLTKSSILRLVHLLSRFLHKEGSDLTSTIIEVRSRVNRALGETTRRDIINDGFDAWYNAVLPQSVHQLDRTRQRRKDSQDSSNPTPSAPEYTQFRTNLDYLAAKVQGDPISINFLYVLYSWLYRGGNMLQSCMAEESFSREFKLAVQITKLRFEESIKEAKDLSYMEGFEAGYASHGDSGATLTSSKRASLSSSRRSIQLPLVRSRSRRLTGTGGFKRLNSEAACGAAAAGDVSITGPESRLSRVQADLQVAQGQTEESMGNGTSSNLAPWSVVSRAAKNKRKGKRAQCKR